ncbi:MAG: nucleotidyltransferase family protein [Bacteroidia bacterium]|nr:nucleotidyltransferase family protein [Bacteroidia bacterium]
MDHIKCNHAIILAGGFGTRLRAVIEDVPKPMAPINQIPFLHYLLVFVKKNGISNVTLAVGYKHQNIIQYLGNKYLDIDITYAIETEPLGTGGAIKQALTGFENTFVINGDTYFDVDLQHMYAKHLSNHADITLALKPMQNFSRYGAVELDQNKIIAFHEKKQVDFGYINGGIYILNQKLFSRMQLPLKFSFETDVLQAHLKTLHLNGYVSDGYFIDIGIPEDYAKAQIDFKFL